jgi:hypothetical protein
MQLDFHRPKNQIRKASGNSILIASLHHPSLHTHVGILDWCTGLRWLPTTPKQKRNRQSNDDVFCGSTKFEILHIPAIPLFRSK